MPPKRYFTRICSYSVHGAKKHFSFPAKEEPVFGQILLFPTDMSNQINFFRYNQHVYEKCTSDLMNESGTFFVVLRQVHRTWPFFFNQYNIVGKKKGNFISTKLSIIYISLYSLNDLERSGKNFKTINHFPNQPL